MTPWIMNHAFIHVTAENKSNTIQSQSKVYSQENFARACLQDKWLLKFPVFFKPMPDNCE